MAEIDDYIEFEKRCRVFYIEPLSDKWFDMLGGYLRNHSCLADYSDEIVAGARARLAAPIEARSDETGTGSARRAKAGKAAQNTPT